MWEQKGRRGRAWAKGAEGMQGEGAERGRKMGGGGQGAEQARGEG